MPRGMTQISPGETSSRPNSEKMESFPCCGTSISSPSAFQKQRFFIERLARYTCTTIPLCASGLPEPASVARPSRKSVGRDGMGKGSQRIRLGETPTSSNGPEPSVG